MYQCGHALGNAQNLTHLHIDGVEFSEHVFDGDAGLFGGPILATERPDCYLFMRCRRLEYLSIKGARMKRRGSLGNGDVLAETAIIKMVRRHPTLRWLRSDLPQETVTILKRRHPDITFVSD